MSILSRTLTAPEPTGPATATGRAFTPLPVGPLSLPAATTDDAGESRAESKAFFSVTLGREMPYLVYLPPGYDAQPMRRYPVLYMLHGMGGSYTEWYGYGIFDQADRMMRAGELPPFLIVLPQGDLSYWVDHAGGGPQWGRYVAQDVVAEIDARYRTLAAGRARAIGGLSMGGHGALQVAMNYPGRFGVVGAHSPTLRGQADAPSYFGDAAYFAAHDPATLIRQNVDAARSLTLWVDVGDADWWLAPLTAFHEELSALGIAHQWRTFAGGHEGSYWTANLSDYLRYYGQALAGQDDQ